MIKVSKRTSAAQSYGRGMDNYRIPGFYDVFRDGKKVGFIHGTNAGYMESSDWEIVEMESKLGGMRPVKRFGSWQEQPFKKAKEFAMEYFATR